MSDAVTVALISLSPQILWVIIIATVLIVFYKPIRNDILPRMHSVSALGVELQLTIRQQLEKAADTQTVELPVNAGVQLTNRAQRVIPVLKGAKVLWVDDNPGNNIHERQIMQTLGMLVDCVTTTSDALMLLSKTRYNVLVSDMERNGIADDGLRLLKEAHPLGMDKKVIFYVGAVNPDKGVPAHAFGITNRPDELINLVFDLMERHAS